MNRKKITTIAACLIMALSLTACGGAGGSVLAAGAEYPDCGQQLCN